MTKPLWQILLPTVVDRNMEFARLADRLAPQIEKYNGDIEVVVFWNNYEREISSLRQLMIETATAKYTNFVDDDDLVSEDYCDQIYPLLDGVDYIGHEIEFGNAKVIHSLTCTGWIDDGNTYYRRGTYINPTKRTLMLKAAFKNADYREGIAEDITYSKNIDKLLKTEHFVPEKLYIYRPTDKHAWNNFEPLKGNFLKPVLPKYFKYHPDSTEI